MDGTYRYVYLIPPPFHFFTWNKWPLTFFVSSQCPFMASCQSSEHKVVSLKSLRSCAEPSKMHWKKKFTGFYKASRDHADSFSYTLGSIPVSTMLGIWLPWCWLEFPPFWVLKWCWLLLAPFITGVGVGWWGRLWLPAYIIQKIYVQKNYPGKRPQ